MDESQRPDAAYLLGIFEAAYKKVDTEGYPHRQIAGTKCLAHFVAVGSLDTRQLGVVGSGGAITMFAMVNGKGCVEPVGEVSEMDMATCLQRAGRHIEKVTPSRPEAMYHHPALKPPVRVL